MSQDRPVWLVTGASKGMGLHTVQAALRSGAAVAATSRNAERLAAAVGDDHSDFLSLTVDLGDQDSVAAAIGQVTDRFGSLDVVVNNAGYALLGAIEELPDDQVRANFDINVFGVLNVVRAALPVLRAQRSGHVINMASISATVTSPATGIYSATKAAVLMISEALAAEVAPLGIAVTAVCPGGVRTDFLDSSSSRQTDSGLADYAGVRQTLHAFDRLNHNQGGDPAKVAEALIALTRLADPPTRLYLGNDALHALRSQLRRVADSANAYAELSTSIAN